MIKKKFPLLLKVVVSLALLGAMALPDAPLFAKKKKVSNVVDPNDPTYRLFQLLDSSYEGKLPAFYVLADLYKDPNDPTKEFQHVLRVNYDKDRAYGKLEIGVRSVAELAPEQLKIYTPKEIYEFGSYDTEKFMKSEAGPLGQVGDDYLVATETKPLSSTPITDEARKEYDTFLNQYIIPALGKK